MAMIAWMPRLSGWNSPPVRPVRSLRRSGAVDDRPPGGRPGPGDRPDGRAGARRSQRWSSTWRACGTAPGGLRARRAASVFRLAQPALADMLGISGSGARRDRERGRLVPCLGRGLLRRERVVTVPPRPWAGLPAWPTTAAPRAGHAQPAGQFRNRAMPDGSGPRSRHAGSPGPAWRGCRAEGGRWVVARPDGRVGGTDRMGARQRGRGAGRRAIVIWRFTGARALSETAERRAQRGVAVVLLAAGSLHRRRIGLGPGQRSPRGASGIGIALTAVAVAVMPLLGWANTGWGRGSAPRPPPGRDPELPVRAQAAAVLLGLAVLTATWPGGWWRQSRHRIRPSPAAAAWEGIQSWRGDDCC